MAPGRPTARTNPETELERLYREESTKLWRSIVAFTGDREIAEDAVAEAFTLLMEKWEKVSSPAGWVWKVAFRTALAELKRRRRQGYPPLDSPSEPVNPASELVSALRRLSPNQRAALVLHYYAGYQAKEVAAILGSTAPAVRVHLMRGRRRLRELLEEGDG